MSKYKALLLLLLLFFSGLAYAQDDTTTLTVTGQVVNGSAGGASLEGASIALHLVDGNGMESLRESALDSEGFFTFSDVTANENYIYYATVFYGQGYFISEFLPWQGETALHLAITVYDITSDPNDLQIEYLLMQLVPQTSSGTLQIVQMISLYNVSDRLYITDTVIDDYRQATVQFQLPENAQIVSFMDGEDRLMWSEDTGLLTDTLPVFPDEEHIIHVIYTVPFSDDMTLSMPLPYRFEGGVNLLLAEPLTLSDNAFSIDGQEEVDGDTFTSYVADVSYNADDTLSYKISAEGNSGVVSNKTVLVIIIALIIVVILFIVGLRFLGNNMSHDANSIDALVEQIADLDTQHNEGNISEADYQTQRARLKKRLAKLMSEQA